LEEWFQMWTQKHILHCSSAFSHCGQSRSPGTQPFLPPFVHILCAILDMYVIQWFTLPSSQDPGGWYPVTWALSPPSLTNAFHVFSLNTPNSECQVNAENSEPRFFFSHSYNLVGLNTIVQLCSTWCQLAQLEDWSHRSIQKSLIPHVIECLLHDSELHSVRRACGKRHTASWHIKAQCK
jgi:hypothetical protein